MEVPSQMVAGLIVSGLGWEFGGQPESCQTEVGLCRAQLIPPLPLTNVTPQEVHPLGSPSSWVLRMSEYVTTPRAVLSILPSSNELK